MLQINKNALRNEDSDYSAKLTNEERLGIIALYRAGVKLHILAAAFNVNRRTVSKMVKNSASAYQTDKKEANKYTQEQLYALYVTDEMVVKVNAVAELKE